VAVLWTATAAAESVRFDGHQVLRFVPKTRMQLDVLGSMFLDNDKVRTVPSSMLSIGGSKNHD
jgi:hypothetical protein